MVVSEALRRPTFEQVFALRDRLAGFVDHHQGGGGPDLHPDLDMDMDMDAVDRHLLRMQTLTSPQRTNWWVGGWDGYHLLIPSVRPLLDGRCVQASPGHQHRGVRGRRRAECWAWL